MDKKKETWLRGIREVIQGKKNEREYILQAAKKHQYLGPTIQLRLDLRGE